MIQGFTQEQAIIIEHLMQRAKVYAASLHQKAESGQGAVKRKATVNYATFVQHVAEMAEQVRSLQEIIDTIQTKL